MADINRAKTAATTEAMRRMIYLMLYVLIDKHQAPREDIKQFAEEINYYADSVKNRYITWKDIEHVVKEEYEVYLPW